MRLLCCSGLYKVNSVLRVFGNIDVEAAVVPSCLYITSFNEQLTIHEIAYNRPKEIQALFHTA